MENTTVPRELHPVQGQNGAPGLPACRGLLARPHGGLPRPAIRLVCGAHRALPLRRGHDVVPRWSRRHRLTGGRYVAGVVEKYGATYGGPAILLLELEISP
jgi:hypothetical protein